MPKPSRARERVVQKPRAKTRRAAVKAKKSSAGRKPAPSARPKAAATQSDITPADQQAYVETLIETGQAASLRKDGTLPSGATHKLERGVDGQVIVTRRRFSIG